MENLERMKEFRIHGRRNKKEVDTKEKVESDSDWRSIKMVHSTTIERDIEKRKEGIYGKKHRGR